MTQIQNAQRVLDARRRLLCEARERLTRARKSADTWFSETPVLRSKYGSAESFVRNLEKRVCDLLSQVWSAQETLRLRVESAERDSKILVLLMYKGRKRYPKTWRTTVDEAIQAALS